MCGIAGYLNFDGRPAEVSVLKRMTDAIAHRGPDDEGQHADGALGLGHRRLSIIDLSPAGHQPMTTPDGRYVISYNGEVYNFAELRTELEAKGRTFRSRTDTEVVLAAYAEWGAACLDRFNGMFAFAVWDRDRRELFLARDRYGVKPLYVFEDGRQIVFASEVKAILEVPGTRRGVDLLALNEYFSFQNVFSDRTLFEGVRLLPPGHYLVVPERGPSRRVRYWDFDFTSESDAAPDELREELAARIRDAVVRQCMSDVPVGCYLSGGMDSGTITALAAKHLGRISTFTAGFDLSEAAEHELSFDERESAEHMASLFQTEHYECVLHSGDMEAVMDKLVWHLEDLRVGQCYPNYYVARLASKFVKVVLCGTGGDELFGGYPWRYAAAVGSSHDDYIQNYYRYWKRLVRNRDKPRLFHPDVAARLRELRDGDGVPFESHTVTMFKNVFGRDVQAATPADQVRWSLYFECKTFLHGLLVVEDKLSMAHSLESRVPFLDNDLVELACRVPVRLKVKGLEDLEVLDENLVPRKGPMRGQTKAGKSILRETMAEMLPGAVTGARKQGFSAPDESWFRGRAEEFVRDSLLSGGSRIAEFVDCGFIRATLEEHRAGRHNRRLLIWSLLCMEAWLGRFTVASP